MVQAKTAQSAQACEYLLLAEKLKAASSQTPYSREGPRQRSSTPQLVASLSRSISQPARRVRIAKNGQPSGKFFTYGRPLHRCNHWRSSDLYTTTLTHLLVATVALGGQQVPVTGNIVPNTVAHERATNPPLGDRYQHRRFVVQTSS